MYETNNLFNELSSLIEQNLCKNIMIDGAPGIGKSEIIYQVAAQLNKSIYEIRLYEEGETAVGLPILNQQIAKFAIPEWFNEIQEKQPSIILFDDFHLVPSAIQAYLYRFLTTRILHNYKLNYNPIIIVAGNFDLDSANAADIQSPIMTRFNIALKYDPTTAFLEWAKYSKRIHSIITAYLTVNNNDIYTAEPPPNTMYPCPRTWEYLSQFGNVDKWQYAPGIIGLETSAAFLDFLKIMDKSLTQLLNANITQFDTQIRYAVALANYYITSSVDIRNQIINKISTFNPEAQFLFAKYIYDKDETLCLTLIDTVIGEVVLTLNDELSISKED